MAEQDGFTTNEEENNVFQLCAMFERVEIGSVLEVLRQNKGDVDKTIDQLLLLSPTEPEGGAKQDNFDDKQAQPLEESNVSKEDIAVNDFVFVPQSTCAETSESILNVQVLVEPASRPIEEIVAQQLMDEVIDRVQEQATPKHVPASMEEDFHKNQIAVHKNKKNVKDKGRAERRTKKWEKQMLKLEKREKRREYWMLPAQNNKDVTTQSASIPDKEEELMKQIKELEESKAKLLEEKRSAMKWCITQIDQMKAEIAEKNTIMQQQEEEIKQLRKEKEEKQVQSAQNEKLLESSKDMLVKGMKTISNEIGGGIAKIEKGLKNDGKEWDILDKLEKFVSGLKKEFESVFTASPGQKNVENQQKTKVEALSQEEQEEQRLIEEAAKESLVYFEEEQEFRKHLQQQETEEKAANEKYNVDEENNPGLATVLDRPAQLHSVSFQIQ